MIKYLLLIKVLNFEEGIIISSENKNKQKIKNKNTSSIKFLICFFGFFSIITISTVIYKIPVHITDYSQNNITKIIIEGKSTNEYLSIEDKNTINRTIQYFNQEKFIRQNIGSSYIGYDIHVYFYNNNELIDTLIIHSNNLIQKGSIVYKSENSKSIKNILTLLEEPLKIKN